VLTKSAVPDAKTPRTERGRRTLRKLFDAAAEEFGEKGFHEASVSSITRRAGVALGSFYTYFDSKEALFRALVQDMSERVKLVAIQGVEKIETKGNATSVDKEVAAFSSFLDFAREFAEIYQIIDESKFVAPDCYRKHYETTATRIFERLCKGIERGDLREGLSEGHAWAMMGMAVFLGLRYAVWARDGDRIDMIPDLTRDILQHGIARPLPEDIRRR